jgi:hypothetical protein
MQFWKFQVLHRRLGAELCKRCFAVKQINQSPLWTATLLTNGGPAVRLCRQTSDGLNMPHICNTSKVGVIGLSDNSLSAIAATPSGGLAYQVREFIQAIADAIAPTGLELAQRWSAAIIWCAVFARYRLLSRHSHSGEDALR